MFETSALVLATKAVAATLEEEHGVTWTGETKLITIVAEETGLDNDIEHLYFRMKESGGDTYWVDEYGMDELTDEDMQDR